MIYIQYQGMIKHSLMALSPAGTQADVDILTKLYVEQWWVDALVRRDMFHGIWHRQFMSHNYEVSLTLSGRSEPALVGVRVLRTCHNASLPPHHAARTHRHPASPRCLHAGHGV